MPVSICPLLLLEGGDVHGHHPNSRYGGFVRYWGAALDQLLIHNVRPTVVFTRDMNPLAEEAQRRGLATHALNSRRAWDYPTAGRNLARIAKDAGANIIHANETIQAFIASIGRTPIPIVFHRHHIRMNARNRPLQTVAERNSTAVMAVSSAVAHRAMEDGVHPRKLWVCHNGIPEVLPTSEASVLLRSKYGIAEDELVTMVVGHLRKEKGFDRFIRAVSQLSSNGTRVRAIVVGDGPERDALHSLSKQTRAAVDFVGHQEEVMTWIGLADILVIPSRSEPFGLVAVEALSQGKAILATRVGGLPEVISPGCGLLVDSNQESIAEGLQTLVQDSELRAALARAGRARFRDSFTSAQMVNRWLLCYASVLADKR